MKEFNNDKSENIVPRILGGLTITAGLLVFLVVVISVPFIFIPSFKAIKIIIIALIDLTVYGIASYIDVSNKGLENIVKRLFSKRIDAIKIKDISPFILKDDS